MPSKPAIWKNSALPFLITELLRFLSAFMGAQYTPMHIPTSDLTRIYKWMDNRSMRWVLCRSAVGSFCVFTLAWSTTLLEKKGFNKLKRNLCRLHEPWSLTLSTVSLPPVTLRDPLRTSSIFGRHGVCIICLENTALGARKAILLCQPYFLSVTRPKAHLKSKDHMHFVENKFFSPFHRLCESHMNSFVEQGWSSKALT